MSTNSNFRLVQTAIACLSEAALVADLKPEEAFEIKVSYHFFTWIKANLPVEMLTGVVPIAPDIIRIEGIDIVGVRRGNS